MKKRAMALMIVLSLIISVLPVITFATAPEIKNIIMLIPDGGGYGPYDFANMVKVAGGFDAKFSNKTETDTNPMYMKDYLRGSMIVGRYNNPATDSAAAGTAMSSGVKTMYSYIGVDHEAKPRATILEAAQTVGKATGLVTTVLWTEATPAAFSAHATDRNDYENMSIQIENQGIDVVLSPGYNYLEDYGANRQNAKNNGYKIIKNKADLESVVPGDKLWADMSGKSLPMDIKLGATQPTLEEMTNAALTALSADEDGFFLMVEGSNVDQGGHSNDAVYMTSEYLAFDAAFKAAVEWAKKRNDTVVICAPDHDTGGMQLTNNMAEEVKLVRGGTNPTTIGWESGNHTTQNVGVWMYTPAEIDVIEGLSPVASDSANVRGNYVIDNTALAPYMADLFGLNLDDLTKELFVDVTDMGTYDSESGKFTFSNGDKYVYKNQASYYKNGQKLSMDGKVSLYVGGKFYVPADIIEEGDGTVGTDILDGIKGQGTKADPYLIENAYDFVEFTNNLNSGETYEGKYIKQSSNIDLKGKTLYVGAKSTALFKGTFDGNGKTINVSLNGENRSVFPEVSGVIVNTGVTGTVVNSGSVEVGAIATSVASGGIIANSYSNAIAPNGIAGVNNGVIENCYFGGSTSGYPIAKKGSGLYKNCYYIEGTQEEATKVTDTAGLGATLDSGRESVMSTLNMDEAEVCLWVQIAGKLPYLEVVVPTVENVSVTPATATLNRGDSISLSATVTGEHNPSQGVKWSIEPASVDGSAVSSDGVLTISLTEKQTQFTVLAKSLVDGSKAGRAIITINQPDKVFDLDVNVYNGTDYKETTDGKHEVTIKRGIKNGAVTGSITKKSFTNMSGDEIPYLELLRGNTSNSQNPNQIIVAGDDIGGEKTVSFWVKYKNGGLRYLVGIMPYDENGNKLGDQDIMLYTTSKDTMRLYGASSQSAYKKSTPCPGEWVNIVLSKEYNADFTQATSKYYMNGTLISTMTEAITSYKEEKSGKVYIGALDDEADYSNFNQYMMEEIGISRLSIYDAVLNDKEVLDLYGAQVYDFVLEGEKLDGSCLGHLGGIDYSDYETGSYTADELIAKDANMFYNQAGVYSIKETAGGNALYLESRYSGSRSPSSQITLSESVSFGKLTTDMVIKLEGEGLARFIFTPFSKEGTSVGTLQFRKKYRYNGANIKNQPTADENGFNRLSFVMTSPDIMSDWTLNVYDELTGVVIHNQTIPRTTLSNIASIRIGSASNDNADYDSHTFAISKATVTAEGIYDIRFTDEEGIGVKNLADLTEVNLDYNIAGASDGIVYIVKYGEDGESILEIEKLAIAPGSSEGRRKISVNGAKAIKVFVWEKGTIMPMLKAPVTISK